MDKLYKLVEKLEKEKDKNGKTKILQNINTALLQQYVIQIDDIIIEPLWIETYYFDEEKFPDCNSHMSEKQRNRFGQLYFHEYGRGGLDICLSNKDNYYLSVLLKATLVNQEFKKQTEIYAITEKTDKKESDIENIKKVLVPKERCPSEVFYTKRIGLTKPCYQDEKLAAVRSTELAKYDFQFARKELAETAVEFFKTKKADQPDYTKAECEGECKKIFGWFPDKVRVLCKNW